MGSWWRSEEMTYVSIILSEESAPACVRELGVMGCVQFTDLNPDLTPQASVFPPQTCLNAFKEFWLNQKNYYSKSIKSGNKKNNG
jgi:vacuolar-type H+-ATPase subunit I/STV1